eukprot:scaffold34733_cov30-Attheya_sp.AAC.2
MSTGVYRCLQVSTGVYRRVVNGAPPNGALFPHHPKYLEPVSSQPNSGLTIRVRRTRHGRIGDQDREGPMRETEPELLGAAGNSRQAPITIKVAFLGSMLGPSALFNTGYRPGLLPIPVFSPFAPCL